MKLSIKHMLLAPIIALAVGCAQLGLAPPPETFSQRVAAGYLAVTQVATTANDLVVSEKITKADGAQILETATVAKKGLDVAKDIAKTDLTAAEGKVAAIRTSLTALSAYLATRRSK